MTDPPSSPSWADTMRRWTRESSADTRRPGGPEGRVYAVPFAGVWDEILAFVQSRRRWSLDHRDEELGIFSISCTSLVFRFVDDLTVWVSLDRDGLTRVDALSRSRVGRGDLGVNRRRIERLMRHLDGAVGSEHRLPYRRTPRTAGPATDDGARSG